MIDWDYQFGWDWDYDTGIQTFDITRETYPDYFQIISLIEVKIEIMRCETKLRKELIEITNLVEIHMMW
jgi:hypothetical protein